MAFQESDLVQLDKAIKSGRRRLRYADGTEAEYHSVKDMIAARALIKSEIAEAAGKPAPRLFRVFQSGRG